MKKREAAMQTIFKHWLQANWQNGSAAFELKRTLTNRLPVRAVQEHQRDALVQAAERSLYYKIPDDSYGAKPFDCFILQGALSFIVVGFGSRLTGFYVIPIDIWLEQTEGRTSVTEEEVLWWRGVKHVTFVV